tara:strand:- start:882 stop:1220 length:339 start_codon:yes stop_codon:yes gene_type:complete
MLGIQRQRKIKSQTGKGPCFSKTTVNTNVTPNNPIYDGVTDVLQNMNINDLKNLRDEYTVLIELMTRKSNLGLPGLAVSNIFKFMPDLDNINIMINRLENQPDRHDTYSDDE